MSNAKLTMAKDLGGFPPGLLQCDMDINEFIKGQFAANATVLRDDEWKLMQDAVVEYSRLRTTIVNDLVAAGLTFPIANGLGTMVLEYEKVSDMNEAQMSMAAEGGADGDRPEFTQAYLPLPIIHTDYQINARALAASRRNGHPLDVTQAQIAGKKIGEKIEEIFAVGTSSYTYGGGTIYGLLDAPNENDYTVTAHWDDSGADPLADIIGMKADLVAARHYGPYMVYVPTAWAQLLDDDLKAASDKSIYNRIKEIQGIIDIKPCDKLTADYMVMVEFQPWTIQAVIGMQPTNVEWATHGGMTTNYKAMSIVIPKIVSDAGSRSGVCVGTK